MRISAWIQIAGGRRDVTLEVPDAEIERGVVAEEMEEIEEAFAEALPIFSQLTSWGVSALYECFGAIAEMTLHERHVERGTGPDERELLEPELRPLLAWTVASAVRAPLDVIGVVPNEYHPDLEHYVVEQCTALKGYITSRLASV